MRRVFVPVLLVAALWLTVPAAGQTPALPSLTEPVNDFAGVIDVSSAASLDRLIRALEAKTTDALVVATVPTFEPYADAKEYAVKLFENGGRGIGRKGRDNGVLVLLSVKERSVRIEVGYDLESIITDGFAGETSRDTMVPFFRQGEYGQGLLAGVQRLASRIADARGVTLDGSVPAPAPPARRRQAPSLLLLIGIFIAFRVVARLMRMSGGGRWGGGGWSGWSGGGVGGFGGGGGSFGGGFGGFGGGSCGGGGGGASW